jgi:hypothetical protein
MIDPLTALQRRVDKLVEAGQLTQAQADNAKAKAEAARSRRPVAPVKPVGGNPR